MNVIAITDYNTIKGALVFRPLLIRHGIKSNFDESQGEVNRPFFARTAKQIMGVTYFSHPYDKKRYLTAISQLEVNNIGNINGRIVKQFFLNRQIEIAKYYLNEIFSSGSEVHTFFVLDRNVRKVPMLKSKHQFLQLLRETKFIKKNCLQLGPYFAKSARIVKTAQNKHLFTRKRVKRWKETNYKCSN